MELSALSSRPEPAHPFVPGHCLYGAIARASPYLMKPGGRSHISGTSGVRRLMARTFLEPGTPPKVRAYQSFLQAGQCPSQVAMARDTGRSTGDIPFSPNPRADWRHVPYFNFRSFMFESVTCNGALADLFMYSNTLNHPVVVSKPIAVHWFDIGRPQICPSTQSPKSSLVPSGRALS